MTHTRNHPAIAGLLVLLALIVSGCQASPSQVYERADLVYQETTRQIQSLHTAGVIDTDDVRAIEPYRAAASRMLDTLGQRLAMDEPVTAADARLLEDLVWDLVEVLARVQGEGEEGGEGSSDGRDAHPTEEVGVGGSDGRDAHPTEGAELMEGVGHGG